jgi:hypothetical protein
MPSAAPLPASVNPRLVCIAAAADRAVASRGLKSTISDHGMLIPQRDSVVAPSHLSISLISIIISGNPDTLGKFRIRVFLAKPPYEAIIQVVDGKSMSILDKGVAFGQSRSVLDKNVGFG